MDEQTITDASQPQGGSEYQDSQLSLAVDESAEVATTDTQPTKAESVSDTDNQELIEWATKKGLDPQDPMKALRVARETEQQYHSNQQQASELRKQLAAMPENPYGDPDVEARMNSLEGRLAVSDFYINNPEAKQLDTQMADLVQAKPYLAQDLDALYTLAKAAKSTADIKAAEDRGRNEAKQQLAREGASSITSGNSSVATPSTGKLSPEAIASMTTEEYAAHRSEVQSQYN